MTFINCTFNFRYLRLLLALSPPALTQFVLSFYLPSSSSIILFVSFARCSLFHLINTAEVSIGIYYWVLQTWFGYSNEFSSSKIFTSVTLSVWAVHAAELKMNFQLWVIIGFINIFSSENWIIQLYSIPVHNPLQCNTKTQPVAIWARLLQS